MRIVHQLYSQGTTSGGVSVVANALSNSLNQHPIESTLLSQTDLAGLSLAAWATVPPRQRRRVRQYGADVLHTHGLWLPLSLASRSLTGTIATVVSPHGMLDPWARQQRPYLKQLLWWLVESSHLQTCNVIHALCQAEAQGVRQLGVKTPLVVIPNGVELPVLGVPLANQPPWQVDWPEGRVLLFLGRLHPKKGLDVLLQAWRRVEEHPVSQSWFLALVGWGNTHLYQQQIADLGLNRCGLYGPCWDQEKAVCFARADGFILPSYSEGLPMAVLEAWSWALPTLMSPACNLPQGYAHGAAWPIDLEVKALASRILDFLPMSEADRQTMQQAARGLVERDFTWPQVTGRMRQVYDWLLGGGQPPDDVQ